MSKNSLNRNIPVSLQTIVIVTILLFASLIFAKLLTVNSTERDFGYENDEVKKLDRLETELLSYSSVTLRNGMRHKDVKKLKADLAKLGFPVPGKGTTLYGVQTERKVREFQSYYGLVADGIAGNATFTKITTTLATPLQNGKRHQSTRQLKRDLKEIGYPVPGNGTTLYGKDTEAVVKRFQKDKSLVVNGIADEVTLRTISQLVNANNNGGAEVAPPVADGNGNNNNNNSNDGRVVLQNGVRHKDVRSLKADLATLGYPVPGNGTTYYGKDTERVVTEFQRANGLTPNGIADDATLAKIASLIATTSKAVKIFIDPGHGGSDPGATHNGLREKDLTLDIAKRVEKYLSEYKGVVIKMTRTTDKRYELKERTDMANAWKADFFFSVHINSFSSPSANGFESFVYNKNPSKDEIEKQKVIHDHIAKNIDATDRGKKRANFHVLRESNMTAMLVEYLFISNAAENKQLSNANYRDKLAKLTAEGIAKAYNLKK